MPDMSPIKNGVKQGDALLPLLFNFALVYAIRRVRVNQGGLKLNGTHQLLFMLVTLITGQNLYTINKNTDTLVFASQEIGF